MKEATFLRLEFDTGTLKRLKNDAHLFFVIFHILTKHKNVAQEYEIKREKVFIETAWHKSLEISGRVA